MYSFAGLVDASVVSARAILSARVCEMSIVNVVLGDSWEPEVECFESTCIEFKEAAPVPPNVSVERSSVTLRLYCDAVPRMSMSAASNFDCRLLRWKGDMGLSKFTSAKEPLR